MGRVGQPPQAGFMTPQINRPDSFTVSGPVTTEGKAVFFLKGGANITVIPGKTSDTRLIGDSGNLPEFPFTGGTAIIAGDLARGQRILNTGTTSAAQAAGLICVQPQGTFGPWVAANQLSTDQLNSTVGVKSNEGDTENVFIREGCVGLNQNASIGKAFLTTTGTATDWTGIDGNIFQVGYGLGDASGSAGKGFFADFTQQARYPLDYLDKDARWFAFSTRRLSYESDLCMTVYRNDDPTDTADIGWDVNGTLNVSQILTFSAGANVRVKTWYNQSGNGYHATADTGASATRGPKIYDAGLFTFGGNGRLALKFDGAQSLVADTGGSGDVDQPLWATVCGKFDSAGVTGYYFDGDDADRTLIFQDATGLIRFGAGTYPSGGAANTNDNLYVCQYNGLNGVLTRNGTNIATGNVGTGDNDGMTIGSRYTNSAFLEGEIAEIVMFKGNTSMALTDAWISRFITQTNNFYDLY